MLSINAVKALEIGPASKEQRWKRHNDPFYMDEKGEVRKTNNAGGTLGGITAGRYLFPRGVQTGFDHEETAYGHTEKQEETEFEASGRHDLLFRARCR